ncbi:MAG: HEAT repeat domain-containing protein [Planctomycetota bacterium]|nr:HEAT repeat domain-containing protein [Planctomycetota bacterium]
MGPQFLATSILLLLPLPARPLVGAADIDWQPSYEAALLRAADEDRVLFVAVNMDGERANDRTADKTYHDKTIVGLSEHTLNLVASLSEHAKPDRTCPRFGDVTCADHRRVDIDVRENVLAPDDEGYVIAPQHVFLKPDGEVILSVPYEISAAELEWCFVTALQVVDPDFTHRLSAGARAPRRLIMGAVSGAGAGQPPPTREELMELISEVKKGSLRGGERMAALRRILLADEPEAIEFIRTELRRGPQVGRGGGGRRGGGGGGRGGGDRRDQRGPLLHTIGVRSPISYWEVLVEFATGSDALLRAEAVVALEQLAAPDSVRDIRSALKREKVIEIEKNLLRALGSAGAADKKTRETLLSRVKKEKDALLRANAIVALGYLTRDEEVDERLHELLEGDDTDARVAAACAIALTREKEWLEPLQAAATVAEENNDKTFEAACSGARAVLEGGDLKPIESALTGVCRDEIARERLFGGEEEPRRRDP